MVTATWINTRLALKIQSPGSPLNMFVRGNDLTLVAYAVLLSVGISFRNQSAIHRRLVLLSSIAIAIVGPAFARLAFWPLLGGSGVAGMILCILTLAAHDRLTLGRVHKATWGGIATIMGSIGMGTGVALMGLGFAALTQIRALT